MPAKGILVVRAVVADPALRLPFDDWYAVEHLPDAVASFGAARGWRCWSRTDPSVHYAFYEFPDVAAAEAVPTSPAMGRLVRDFDARWGDRIPRTRDVLAVAGSHPPMS